MTSEFTYPVQYSFPPFFTIQPNNETKQKQLAIWTKLILNYCECNRMFILEKSNNLPIFNNQLIARQLSISGLEVILNHMEKENFIEWMDARKERCFVYWNNASEWGGIIYAYAEKHGLQNTVETFYELANSKSEFQRMPAEMLKKCLLTLNGRAEVIGDDGVKFF